MPVWVAHQTLNNFNNSMLITKYKNKYMSKLRN